MIVSMSAKALQTYRKRLDLAARSPIAAVRRARQIAARLEWIASQIESGALPDLTVKAQRDPRRGVSAAMGWLRAQIEADDRTSNDDHATVFRAIQALLVAGANGATFPTTCEMLAHAGVDPKKCGVTSPDVRALFEALDRCGLGPLLRTDANRAPKRVAKGGRGVSYWPAMLTIATKLGYVTSDPNADDLRRDYQEWTKRTPSERRRRKPSR